ncbi:hypothetical protein RQP46_009469 [Phenoliferia psychrophenolica]
MFKSSVLHAAKRLPLTGVKVLEFGGLAPGPYAGMILADFGADVVRVDRTGISYNRDQLTRNKRSIAINAKSDGGKEVLQRLAASSDVIIDPFRPGVLERLGVGPKDCERLSEGKAIFARLTGYRSQGPYSKMAGHDLNYLALSGVLATIRPPGLPPIPPNNYMGDYAGGGLMCALGVMMALFERSVSGLGQLVEADMVTGARYIGTGPFLRARPDANLGPGWAEPAGQNVLDGGCPFYALYPCADGQFVSIAPLEEKFYAEFIELLAKSGVTADDPGFAPSKAAQHDRQEWPALRAHYASIFKQKTRDEWATYFLHTDACVAPVLEPHEIGPDGEGLLEVDGQRAWSEHGGIPEPAPSLARTPALRASDWYQSKATPAEQYFLTPGAHTKEILQAAGYSEGQIAEMLAAKVVQG